MLRIVAGKHRGRKLSVPDGLGVRPTSDRMRERLFSMLMHHRYPDLYQANVADFFAGSGALGLEALSRGAGHVTFVELNSAHAKNLNDNIAILKEKGNCKVIKGSATTLPQTAQAMDIIFMDPPYHKGLAVDALTSALKNGWINKDTTIILETGSDEVIDLPDELKSVDEKIQGKQKVQFLQWASE